MTLKIYLGAGAKCGGKHFVPSDVVLHLEFTLIIKMDVYKEACATFLVWSFWFYRILWVFVIVGVCGFFFFWGGGINVLFLLLFVTHFDFVIPEPGWITAKRKSVKKNKSKRIPLPP